MFSDDLVIEASGLGKRYEIYEHPRDRLKQMILPRLYRLGDRIGLAKLQASRRYFREFWALQNVSFQVRQGETLGIIGRNGSGKSTLLQILAGTLSPTSGHVQVNGRIAALLELGSGFNPEFSGKENVLLNARILGLSQKEIEERYDQIVAFADIGEFIEQPVKTYSSGMFVRLAFAVQAHIDASIVIIDEALAVGDVFFRQKCYARLEALRESGAAIILVSHSMPDIEQYCKRAIVLNRGEVKFVGPAVEASKRYYLLNQPSTPSMSLPPRQPVAAAHQPLPETSADEPAAEAFLNIERLQQVSDGRAHCTRCAISDKLGEARSHFRQGETAVFYFEFRLNEEIEVPICGVVIRNERGVIVHGKNSWQLDVEVPATVSSGSLVRCRQEIQVSIAPGEYTFEIGLASVPCSVWKRRHRTPHDEFTSSIGRLCHIPTAGSFAVAAALREGVSMLTHYGLADLSGAINIGTKTLSRNESDTAHAE